MRIFFVSLFSFCLLPMHLWAEPSEKAPALEALQAFIDRQVAEGKIDRDREGWRTRLPKFPEVDFAGEVDYHWVLETSEGEMTFLLHPATAPQHVRNILYLTLLGYYDGLNFHRIIPGFVAQGGCPLGRGNGGPGYTVELEATRNMKHDAAGILSMARTRVPDSAGSQFFITLDKASHLDGGYTVFGNIVDGEEVLDKLEAAGNPNPRSNGVPPQKNIVIRDAEIRPVMEDTAPNE